MKRLIFIIVYSLLFQSINAQIIEGRVIDKDTKEPLMGASIYFEGSSIGTLSDENGYFDLDADGLINAKLIASYIGYSTITINKPATDKPILITMLPKAEQLEEIVIIGDPFSRKEKLAAFRSEFLGESTAADKSVITNEEDIGLYFNTKHNTLTAYSDKPIVIQNSYLGYEIKIDLQDFKIAFRERSLKRSDNVKYTIIQGFSRFSDTSGSDDQKIVDRRADSFFASPAHFMQTLWKNDFTDQNITFRKDGKKITAKNLFKQMPQSELGLKKYRLEKSKISIKYVGKNKYYSTIELANPVIFTVDPYGNCQPCKQLVFGGYMGKLRMADALPLDYTLPIESLLKDKDQLDKNDAAKLLAINEIDTVTVSGIVTDENGPVQDAAVIIKESTTGTLTDIKGEFAIQAAANDSLIIQFLGKRSMMYPVSKETSFLEIFLEEAAESLDEVVVVQKQKVKWLPKAKVSGFGGVQTIDKKDLTVSSGSLNESLAGKFSGVQTNKEGFSRSIIRGFSSIEYSNYPLVIVDGAPMPRANFNNNSDINTDIFNTINPNDVVSVTVLKGLAAANRYGSQGSNGVILIKTRYGETTLTEKKVNKDYNSALLRDNNYIGDLNVSQHEVQKGYLQELEAKETVEESYELYLKQSEQYSSDSYYYINVHNLFQASDADLAKGILNDALFAAKDDVKALRTIAFYHQQAKRYEQALSIYKKIIKLDRSSIQAHRDIANANVQAGNYEKALEKYGEIVSLDFQPTLAPKSVKDLVNLELKNLIFKKGKELDVSKIPSNYKSSPRYDARIILEWNDSETEFEIEFISPERKISKWNHTLNDNPERMQNERVHGFQIEESLLSQAQKGNWYLNVRTLNIDKNKPLFLKCTIQYSYGQAGQYEVEKVFAFNSGYNERIVSEITIR